MAETAGRVFLDVHIRLAQDVQRKMREDAAKAGQGAGQEAGKRAGHGFAKLFGAGIAAGAGLAIGRGAIHLVGAGIAKGYDLAKAGVRRFIDTIKEGVRVYADHQKQLKLIQAHITSTGGAAHLTVGQIDNLSKAIQRKTGIDRHSILDGMQILLTFKAIRNEVGKGKDGFNQASMAVANLSTSFHGDMSKSAVQLGKAMQDPVKGIAALHRVGVNFSDAQVKLIKHFVSTNQMAKAQGVIFHELATETGGSAASQLTAGARLKAGWEGVLLTIGQRFAPVVKLFKTVLADKVIPIVQALAEKYGPGLGRWLTDMVKRFAALLPSAKDLSGHFSDIAKKAEPLVGRLKEMGPQLATVIGAFVKSGGIGKSFSSGLAIAGPILDVIARNMKTIEPILPVVLGAFLGFKAVGPAAKAIGAVSTAIGAVQKVAGGVANGVGIARKAIEFMSSAAIGTRIQLGLLAVQQAAVAIGSKIAAAASLVWRGAQIALNFVLSANPIGIVIIAIAALTAGIIYAYKHSQTFRNIVQTVWAGIRVAIGSAIKFILGMFQAWFNVATTVVRGILHVFGLMPGPMGAPFRSAEKAVTRMQQTVNDKLNSLKRKIDITIVGHDHVRPVVDQINREMKARGFSVTARLIRGGTFAHGGRIPGYGGGDTVPAMLEPGEAVIPKHLVPEMAGWARTRGIPGFARGGIVNWPGKVTFEASRDALMSWAPLVQGLLSGGGGGSLPGMSGSVAQVALRTLQLLHRPISELAGWIRRIMFESGGNASVVNRTDSNWIAGHPSVGLAQVIRGTFAAWAGPFRNVGPFLYGVSINPLANSYAGANYAIHRYGSLAAVDPRVRHAGYDRGGLLYPGLTLAYNGTGRPERVSPPDAGGPGVHLHFHGPVYGGRAAIDQLAEDVDQALARKNRGRGGVTRNRG